MATGPGFRRHHAPEEAKKKGWVSSPASGFPSGPQIKTRKWGARLRANQGLRSQPRFIRILRSERLIQHEVIALDRPSGSREQSYRHHHGDTPNGYLLQLVTHTKDTASFGP